MNPFNFQATQVHWDALADILGEVETGRLYGPRPELVNTSSSVERLYFDDRAPRRAVWVAVALGLLMAGSVVFGALHHHESSIPVQLEPCALVLTQSGQVCR